MPGFQAFRGMIRPAILWPPACVLYFWLSYRSTAYLAGALAVLAGFYALYASWDRVRGTPLGLLMLGALASGLPALGMWQAFQLQDLGDLDHADYVCAFWNLMHGGTRYSINDLDIFGTHANYTCVAWIPVQFLGGEYALKAGKALCLLAAAGLFLRRLWPARREASWGVAALLLSPPIASQFFFGFHPEFLAAPLLVVALEAYRDGRLGRFLACVLVLSYTKEVFTLAVGGILLVALLERRPWKWIVLPGLLCTAQMALYWFVIMPHFSEGGNHLTATYLPASPAQALEGWFRVKTLQYAIHVTVPFLPLLLALPRRYLVLPVPLMAFYSAFPNPLFMVQWPNYAFPLAILCAAGLVLHPSLRIGAAEGITDSAARPPAPSDRPTVPALTLDGRILLSCAVLSLLSYPLWREVFSIPVGNLERRSEVAALRARIPESASVLVHGPIAVHFAARKEVETWAARKRPMEAFDFVVMEASLPYWVGRREELARDIRALSESPRWIREYGRDSLFLFRRIRDSGSGPGLGGAP